MITLMALSHQYASISGGVTSAVRYALFPLRFFLLLPALLAGAIIMLGKDKNEHKVWREDRTLWKAPKSPVEFTVVMPFYNPGDALAPTVLRTHEVLKEAGVSHEIIAVSDGSTDGSEKTLAGMPEEVKVLILPQNRGKGGALHAGFARATGKWVGFVDSDGDIDPAHLLDYLNHAREGGHDIVYANKKMSNSASKSSGFRKLVSFGFSTFVTALFNLGVNDTQTGCKVVRRDVMAEILPRLQETRFAFDLELFVAAATAGYTNHLARPVHLSERLAGSTVTAKSILRTLADALTILSRRHMTDTYKATNLEVSRVLHPAFLRVVEDDTVSVPALQPAMALAA